MRNDHEFSTWVTILHLDPRAAELAAGRKNLALSRRKNAASRQPGRKKYTAKPPPKVRLVTQC